jgi:hypothetical protein
MEATIAAPAKVPLMPIANIIERILFVAASVGGALASASAGHVAVNNESRCQGVWR